MGIKCNLVEVFANEGNKTYKLIKHCSLLIKERLL